MRRTAFLLVIVLGMALLYPAAAFDPAALKELPAFVQEEGKWRLELQIGYDLLLMTLDLGIVAEGEGAAADSPWAWVQYHNFGEMVPVERLELRVDGTAFEYVNLDLQEDSEGMLYGSWYLGTTAGPLLKALEGAQKLGVRASWGSQYKEIVFDADQVAAARDWAKALVEADWLPALDQQPLKDQDRYYYAPVAEAEPELTGETVQASLSGLPGYSYDRRSQWWRYEESLYEGWDGKQLTLGFNQEGSAWGSLAAPWVSVEYLIGGRPQSIYQMKVETDEREYIVQRPYEGAGYVSWSLGLKTGVLIEDLTATRSLDVTLYHGETTEHVRFAGADLAPLRRWAKALGQVDIWSGFDSSQLMRMDIEHIAQVRSKLPAP